MHLKSGLLFFLILEGSSTFESHFSWFNAIKDSKSGSLLSYGMWNMFIIYIAFSLFFPLPHLIDRAWVWQWPELVDVLELAI